MLHVKLTLNDCVMLSEALTQYLENAEDAEHSVAQMINLDLAARLLEVVELTVAGDV